ncbi:MAG: glycogen/starch synthase, partial [Nitrospiraceae bacterium]
MVSSEAVPYAKTGGLADVAGALPQELVRLGHDVRLVIPHYQSIDGTAGSFTEFGRLKVPIAGGTIETIVEESRILLDGEPSTGRVLTIRHDPFFHRSGLYQESGRDYPDNLQRFSFFCRAVIELVGFLHERQRWVPDVLHLHDSQTALCALYAKTKYANRREYSRLRSLMTRH